jgi:hypothetical protein
VPGTAGRPLRGSKSKHIAATTNTTNATVPTHTSHSARDRPETCTRIELWTNCGIQLLRMTSLRNREMRNEMS